MLRHIVMWKLKEFAEGATRAENARKFKERLEACSSLVEGQGLFEVGIAQGGFNCTYDVVLVSEFDDLTTLETYLADPRHQELADFAAPLRQERQCLDYEI
ncbi:hypothetical protein BSFA1_81560 (plasmid) [Burkholderia sp. SFA1]|nr:Stress responsive A/B Barrel Domain family protein [Burkholderia sp. YI23]BBQ03028.1 hypothetical protein BSFA1_81560 [Burkholderia sp. SFA1]